MGVIPGRLIRGRQMSPREDQNVGHTAPSLKKEDDTPVGLCGSWELVQGMPLVLASMRTSAPSAVEGSGEEPGLCSQTAWVGILTAII